VASAAEARSSLQPRLPLAATISRKALPRRSLVSDAEGWGSKFAPRDHQK